MGRVATGVRGIRLLPADYVVGMVVVRQDADDPTAPTLLVATDKGVGKRSRIEDYRLQGRGGKGVINIRTAPRTGKVVAIMGVRPDDELVMITRYGVVNRQAVDQIRVIGRNTQGVRLIALDDTDEVVDVARLITDASSAAEEIGEDQAPATAGPAGGYDGGGDDLP
jgi:DNA gyrase subunit A